MRRNITVDRQNSCIGEIWSVTSKGPAAQIPIQEHKMLLLNSMQEIYCQKLLINTIKMLNQQP